MPPVNLIDPARINFANILADRAAIRAINPQRFEMEMLDAIILVEPAEKLIVGFKDVHADEFWTRGHFPGQPMLPGVLMCEAAAQLCSYFIVSQHVNDEGSIVGFGGMENVRFRNMVRPGDRLALVAQATRLNRRQSIFNVQGFVGLNMAFQADIIGIALRTEAS
jgi:3-hydroxyacyl-[acyl-carrier-protein] dehydratase